MTTPLLVAVGLLAGAAVADLVAHLVGLPALESPAHLATLAGMVATLAAVVSDGVRRHRAARADERHPDPAR